MTLDQAIRSQLDYNSEFMNEPFYQRQELPPQHAAPSNVVAKKQLAMFDKAAALTQVIDDYYGTDIRDIRPIRRTPYYENAHAILVCHLLLGLGMSRKEIAIHFEHVPGKGIHAMCSSTPELHLLGPIRDQIENILGENEKCP